MEEIANKPAAYRRGFFERLEDYSLRDDANPYPVGSYQALQWSLGRRDAGRTMSIWARRCGRVA